ncbi:MAG: hypothetical protein GTO02_15620, partial [Candidatus Dadabacteria bacterium]|nr:hypothetical protein [Candidatus Dadabacteria bacterium]
KLALKELSEETNVTYTTSKKTIANLENSIEKLNKDQDLLMDSLASLQELPNNSEEWALAEVEYL